MPVSRQFENTQRPPSAAAEDRNVEGGRDERGVGLAAAAVRGGRGSQHELKGALYPEGRGRQRPPSAAAEDRNYEAMLDVPGWESAAAAVRGGRGSQLDRRQRVAHRRH